MRILLSPHQIKSLINQEKRLIPLLFQNKFIIGYLKIIAQKIIVVNFQINPCKVSINLLVLTFNQSKISIKSENFKIIHVKFNQSTVSIKFYYT